MNLKVIGRNFLSYVLVVLITFITLEVISRILINNFAGERRFLKYASLRQLQKKYKDTKPVFTPHRYLGYYPTPDHVKGQNNAIGHDLLDFCVRELVTSGKGRERTWQP